MASQTEPQRYAGDVTIYMRDMNSREPIPHRVVYLQPPNFEKKIGRGSHAEQHLNPQPWNTWFSSRVMSREHAVLRADPTSKTLTVEDTGSMHGTYVGGMRIAAGQKTPLQHQDKIQFGTEIIRGDQTYKPLEIMLVVDFENDPFLPKRPQPEPSSAPKNTFRIDFSDEDDEDDEDIELLYESIRVQSSEPEKPSRTFSVPDSETSDSNADQVEQHDSVPSNLIREAELGSPKQICLPTIIDIPTKASSLRLGSESQAPGSSAQNALAIDVDEEENDVTEQDKENQEPVKDDYDLDSISTRSSDDDESFEGGPFYDDDDDDEDDVEDDETHPSDLEADWAQEIGEDDLDEEMGMITKPKVIESQPQSQSQGPPSRNNFTGHHPSSSDCELPKLLLWSQNTQSGNLPTIHNLVEQTSAHPMFPTHTYPVAQPPNFPNYQSFYCGNDRWAHTDNNANFAASFDHGFGAQPLPTMSFNAPYTCTITAPVDAHNVPHSEIPSPYSKDESLTKSSKVSINDIIDDTQMASTTSSHKHKRKAEEISKDVVSENSVADSNERGSPQKPADDHADGSTVLQQPNEPVPNTDSALEAPSASDMPVEKLSPSKKSVTFSSEAVIIEPNPGRLRKRVKTQHEPQSQGGNFFKYFATALAGATVGAVGTVFGLAALPVDYFV